MTELALDIRADGVAVLTLDAPTRRNSLTVALAREIVTACTTIDADERIGAVVVAAKGPVFCAGADRALLADIGADPASEQSYSGLVEIYAAFGRVSRLAVPTITAVTGAAVGAGLNLALSADLCVVADDARLLSGFLPLGVHPGGGHFSLVARRAGPQVTAALALFGQELTGTQSVAAGLAFEAHPSASVLPRALELAAVAGGDPMLSRRATDSMTTQLDTWLDPRQGTRIEHAAQMWSLRRRSTT